MSDGYRSAGGQTTGNKCTAHTISAVDQAGYFEDYPVVVDIFNRTWLS